MNAAQARRAMLPDPDEFYKRTMESIHAGIEVVAKAGVTQIRIPEPREACPGLREKVKQTLASEGYRLSEVVLEKSRIQPGRVVWEIDWSE